MLEGIEIFIFFLFLTTLSFTKRPLMNSKHALYTVEMNLNSEFHFHFC